MLKIGWVSASPVAQTGYGRETREIGYRLVDMGLNVTFIGSMGADVVVWGGVHEQETPKGNKVTILTLTDSHSAPTVISKDYAPTYGFDVIIGFMDCFGLEFLNEVDLPVIGYIPIDGAFTTKMKAYLRHYYKLVAYSQFGYRELQQWYPPSKIEYIPHGIDTEQFRPLQPDEYDEAREWLATDGETRVFAPPVPRDTAFLAVDMAANIGPRKLLPLLMRTWSTFVKNHLDDPPHLLLQTNAYAPGRGYDLIAWRNTIGMEDYIHFPVYDPIIHPVSDENLRKIFGAADVFVHNAVAEGYGLPLVEAASCGVPPIAPDNSAQTENVTGHGWLVENVSPDEYIDFPVYVPTLQQYPFPNQQSLLEQLEAAYAAPDQRKEYGRKARQFVVQNYAWERVMPRWIEFLAEVDADLEMFKKIGAVLSGPPAEG